MIILPIFDLKKINAELKYILKIKILNYGAICQFAEHYKLQVINLHRKL